MTLRQLNTEFISRLSTIYDSGEARAITDLCLEATGSISRAAIIRAPDVEISEITFRKLQEQLNELMHHKPVQYVLGKAWFYHLPFKVNESVLIPRPETEELVKAVLDEIPIVGGGMKVLDIGTGSGCIAIALKKNEKKLEVTAADKSKKALQTARENALNNEVKINFIHADILNMEERDRLFVYDIIVSNPPYIPWVEKKSMQKNVTEFEPAMALFVSDEDPLIFYKAIANMSHKQLAPNGIIFVEIHERLAKETAAVFEKENLCIQILKDIYGKDRLIRATRCR